eukprot:scaffold336622_cov17-Prasinocladus_malaysianus.AAC.1
MTWAAKQAIAAFQVAMGAALKGARVCGLVLAIESALTAKRLHQAWYGLVWMHLLGGACKP